MLTPIPHVRSLVRVREEIVWRIDQTETSVGMGTVRDNLLKIFDPDLPKVCLYWPGVVVDVGRSSERMRALLAHTASPRNALPSLVI